TLPLSACAVVNDGLTSDCAPTRVPIEDAPTRSVHAARPANASTVHLLFHFPLSPFNVLRSPRYPDPGAPVCPIPKRCERDTAFEQRRPIIPRSPRAVV